MFMMDLNKAQLRHELEQSKIREIVQKVSYLVTRKIKIH
jgi:hypothetical protein